MTPRVRRRAYLREATAMLALAQIAVRYLPAKQLFRWADRPPRNLRRFTTDEPDWVEWAITHAAERTRRYAACLPRALAAHAMLRRRGIASRLCIGVAPDGETIAAHAWIEIGDRKLIDDEDAVRFTRLASYGGGKTN